MALKTWQNHFNDSKSTDTITAVVCAAGGDNPGPDTGVISVSSFDSTEWAVGNEFNITDHTTLYSLTAITELGGGAYNLGFTPPTEGPVAHGEDLVTKEGSYKGNHTSVETFLRLRNQGQI